MVCLPPRKCLPITIFITNQDLILIEEAFERLLLDYDRVFAAMGVPACLWRRTGEIYKGNREFTELVGVDGSMMRDVSFFFPFYHLCILVPDVSSSQGQLCIYELMSEESAVNYWEVRAFCSQHEIFLTFFLHFRNTGASRLIQHKRRFSRRACYGTNPISTPEKMVV